jgi:hypothetical protein
MVAPEKFTSLTNLTTVDDCIATPSTPPFVIDDKVTAATRYPLSMYDDISQS